MIPASIALFMLIFSPVPGWTTPLKWQYVNSGLNFNAPTWVKFRQEWRPKDQHLKQRSNLAVRYFSDECTSSWQYRWCGNELHLPSQSFHHGNQQHLCSRQVQCSSGRRRMILLFVCPFCQLELFRLKKFSFIKCATNILFTKKLKRVPRCASASDITRPVRRSFIWSMPTNCACGSNSTDWTWEVDRTLVLVWVTYGSPCN